MIKKASIFIVAISILACSNINNQEKIENQTEKTENRSQSKKSTTSDDFDYAKFGLDKKNLPQGLKKGTIAPEFSTTDLNGNIFSLSELKKKGKVVLFFFRGNWCPYCTKHIAAFTDSLHLIKEKGASVIAISPEKIKFTEELVKEKKVPFTIIPDETGKIMDLYKVKFTVIDEYINLLKDKYSLDLTPNYSGNNVELPIPATYIISKEGLIEYVHFEYNYSLRSSISEIIEKL